MKAKNLLQDQTFWYVKGATGAPLRTSLEADVVVLGGGMAGLTAAHSFKKRGLNVVLLEKNYCGSGASGKSSGFITPDSELSLSDLEYKFDKKSAELLWDFVSSGVEIIRQNIEKYSLECDYREQKTLVLARDKKSYEKMIIPEQKARERYGLSSQLLLKNELQSKIATGTYYGGIMYSDSFGIKAYDYCYGMKQVVQDEGVQIYEESPVIEMQENKVITPQGAVKAQYIVVCLDHFVNDLKLLIKQVYHAQTFLLLSNRLTDAQIAAIFPNEQYMAWDTELIYNYFRLTGDNRLMLGGASLLYTYARQEAHKPQYIINKLINYFQQQFPRTDIQFCYMWPGLIGVSKDLLPVAGFDNDMKSVYYVTAATGLPWAAALGEYSAQHIVDGRRELDSFFDPYRFSTLEDVTQTVFGAPVAFALSHAFRVSSV